MPRLPPLLLATVTLLACADRHAVDFAPEDSEDTQAPGDTEGDALDPAECSDEPVLVLDYARPDRGPECEPFHSEQWSVPRPVHVTNRGTVPLYLTGLDCIDSYFAVADAEDAWWPGPHCRDACDGIMMGMYGCLANCPTPTTLALMPGATVDVGSWPGLLWEQTQMPESCAVEGEGGDEVADWQAQGGTCNRAIEPTAGPLRATLVYALEVEDATCTEDPGDAGWCDLGLPYIPDEDRIRVERDVPDLHSCAPIELALP